MSVLLGAMLVALLVTESAFQQTDLNGKVAAREWRMQRPDAQIWRVPNPKAANHAPFFMGPSTSHLTPMADNALQVPLSADPARPVTAVQLVDGQQPLPTASSLTAPLKLQPVQSHHPAPPSPVSAPNVDELRNHHCVSFTLWSAMKGPPDLNNFTPWACAPAAALPTQLAKATFYCQTNHDTPSSQADADAPVAISETLTAAADQHETSRSTALLPFHSFVLRPQLAAEFTNSHMPSYISHLGSLAPLTMNTTASRMSTAVAVHHSHASRQQLAAESSPIHVSSITPDFKKHATGILHIPLVSQHTQHMTLAALIQPIVTEAYITPQLDSEQASRKVPASLLATDKTRTAVHKPESKQTLQSQNQQLFSLAFAPGQEVCLPVDALKQGTAGLYSNSPLADVATEGPYAAPIVSNTYRIVSGVLSVAMPEALFAGEQVAALPMLFLVSDCCAAAPALVLLT